MKLVASLCLLLSLKPVVAYFLCALNSPARLVHSIQRGICKGAQYETGHITLVIFVIETCGSLFLLHFEYPARLVHSIQR